MSPESATLAAPFWERYRKAHPRCPSGARERLLNTLFLHSEGLTGALTYKTFKADFESSIGLIETESAAFLWDRLGHWAQDEDNWTDAERCFQKAYSLAGDEYGYCLGVALNFLERPEESLPILLVQAEGIQPDDMSWFQVATAYEMLGHDLKSVEAYKKAIALNPKYEQAWFNMGGVHWNVGDLEEAQRVWNTAIALFPGHELAIKAQLKMAIFLP